MRIKYVTNVRIPTSRAQGYAIMKMCSEFGKLAETILFIPKKGNNEDRTDPFDFYKVDKSFQIKKVPSFDFLALTLRFGRLFYWLDTLSFLLMLRFKVSLQKDDVLYTRDFLTSMVFSRQKFLVLELHDIPRSNAMFGSLVKRFQLFFVLNNNIKKDLLSFGIPENKVFVFPSGVDLDELRIGMSMQEARNKLDLPQGVKIVLYAGQFYSWKGVDTLADAAALLPEATFVFVGGAIPESEIFIEKYKNVANIIIRPFQERSVIAQYLKASDVLVIPNSSKKQISSRYTSPLKMFEYMAVQKPIVASDLPSLREVLTEDDCLFATADGPQDFARAIKKVLDDPGLGTSLSNNAFAKVGQFTWDKRAKGIFDKIRSWT